MKDFIEYKGYIGSVEFSAEDDVFHGRVQEIRDLVTYEGTDIASLKQSLCDAVDDYLSTCKRRVPDGGAIPAFDPNP